MKQVYYFKDIFLGEFVKLMYMETNTTTGDQPKETQNTKLLFRSTKNKMIGGVAGGIAEYFSVDPNIIRLVFIFLVLFGGSGVLLYLVLWLLLPAEDHLEAIGKDTMKENMSEMKEAVQGFTKGFRSKGKEKTEGPQLWLGIIIVILGILFLLNNLGLLDFFEVRKYWPLLLVFFGIYIVSRNER